MSVEQGLKSSASRTLGFAKREIVGITRQPRLILTLILAPFAILLIFGLGYRTEPPPFQTLMVLPGEQARLAAEQADLSEAFGDAIDLVGTTTDATEARARLRTGDVDLLIIGPADAVASLSEGERAEFVVVHGEVDPVIRGSISLLAQLSVDELNKRILAELVSQAQGGTESLDEPLETTRSGAQDLVSSLENGDTVAEDRASTELWGQLEDLEAAAVSRSALYSSVGAALGIANDGTFEALRATLDRATNENDVEAARGFERELLELEQQLNQLQNMDSSVAVSPFSAQVEDIADLPETPALFYGPGTLVILMQHLALTFAALSLVRERHLRLTEIFQASPLAPREILAGKFAAFLVISAAIAAVLTGAMFALGVTIRGSLWYHGLTVLMVIAASLGLGFIISGVAQTDSQAVQYTMMVFLISIFFTGLILPLEQLIPPVRAISYLLPGTYGIAALHDVMFRGLRPNTMIVAGLAVYAFITAIASWWVMRRHVRSAQA